MAKTVKEYFIEFVMIFLAVALGFFAENMRESIGERAREREFVLSLLKDLQTDTLILNHEIPNGQAMLLGIDTLIQQVFLTAEGKGDIRKMYYCYHQHGRSHFAIHLSNRTLYQLRYSDHVDLIQNRKVADFLSWFDYFEQESLKIDEFLIGQRKSAAEFGMKIFDFSVYQKVSDNSIKPTGFNESGFLSLKETPRLLSNDPKLLKEFAGFMGYYRNLSRDLLINRYAHLLPRLEQAIDLVSKEYGIDKDELEKIRNEIKDI